MILRDIVGAAVREYHEPRVLGLVTMGMYLFGVRSRVCISRFVTLGNGLRSSASLLAVEDTIWRAYWWTDGRLRYHGVIA